MVMSLTTLQLQNYAWMSQASYLDFQGLSTGNETDLINKLKESSINGDNSFEDKQAGLFIDTDFTGGFNFISHQANTDEGFSATIFLSNADNSYTFAVRGTEHEK
jgi:hypothetical protein